MNSKIMDNALQDAIKSILVEVYEKAMNNERLLAKEVIGEMVQKLQPFYME